LKRQALGTVAPKGARFPAALSDLLKRLPSSMEETKEVKIICWGGLAPLTSQNEGLKCVMYEVLYQGAKL
jgi:hypothetical protein